MSFDPAPEAGTGGMTRKGALRLEIFIIGLGLLGLIMIFQPISLTLFAVGAGIVVLAGLVNNLLPLAQPGVKVRSVITIGLVVAMIFCIVILLSITAAHLYGVYFLSPPPAAAATALTSIPFYMSSFVWSVAAVAAVLAGLIWFMSRSGKAAD